MPRRPGWFQRGLLVVALLCSLAFAAPALAALRIGVVTMQPGEIFFERFGHNAILVHEPATGEATSYNFGFFDPTADDFIARFVAGEMRYRLLALPFEQDMRSYRQSGRGVSVQWLDLDEADARQLAAALAENARPENAYYRYDYFLDNCSTRVRDALDEALGGGLRRQLEGRSRGSTFRSEAVRLASPAPWMWLAFDIGLGPSADRPLSFWGESYVPMRLASALGEVVNQQGRPLVADEVQLLPHRIAPEPADAPRRNLPWWLAGLAIGAALVWLGNFRPRALAAIALPFWFASGLIGALMLFIWLGTEHRFGWANQNLWLLNPLAWLLLPGGWRVLRGRAPGRWFWIVLATTLALAVVGLFAYWLQALPQRNAHWIALLLPLHAGLMLGFCARNRALARAGHGGQDAVDERTTQSATVRDQLRRV